MLIFSKAPYKNFLVLGYVRDDNGQRMGKSRGKAVDSVVALKTYATDTQHWYFYIHSVPWLPIRFHG